MKVSASQARLFLDKWQHILRLRDWDIAIRIVAAKWKKSGDVKVDMEDKKAVLLINQHPRTCENVEELIIHELLHLKLYGMDQMLDDLFSAVYGEDTKDPKREFAYTQYMVLLESTVEDLTKGYLTAIGSKGKLSFSRVNSSVERELEGTA